MKKICLIALLTLMLLFVLISAVQAQPPQETLTQYLSDLQKNPNDTALREKIIKHVQTMRPAPAIPREAERFMNRGAAAVKSAKDANDFKDAVAEFEKATLSAPWLANAYYNLGVAQDKAGLYTAAIRSLKLYVLAEPNAPDIRSVEKLIDEIEYKQEKAAKGFSPQAIAEKKRQTEEEFIKKLNGVRYVSNWSTRTAVGVTTLDVRGSKIIQGIICHRGCEGGIYAGGGWHQQEETTLNGREFNFSGNCVSGSQVVKRIFRSKISEDGYSVTSEDCTGTIIYRRER